MEPWAGDWCVMLWICTINHRKCCGMFLTMANTGYSYDHTKGYKLDDTFTFPQEATHNLLSNILWHNVYRVMPMLYPYGPLKDMIEVN